MFIYKITNLVNYKVYIGQTIQKKVSSRFNKHKSELKRNKHINKHLQAAWNKYGANSFLFEIIDEGAFVFSLDNLEKYWIHHFDSMNPDKGYNKESGGSKNKIKSQESIEKQKRSHKQWLLSEAGQLFRKQSSLLHKSQPSPFKGRKLSDESRKKISISRLGKNVGKENHKAVAVLDNLGNKFDTVNQAAKFHKILPGSITQILKGRSKKTRQGVAFTYFNEEVF